MTIHDLFDVSLHKKYVYDAKHVIDQIMAQVELKGEFLVEPICIVDEKFIILRSRYNKQVDVYWRYLGLDEATQEMELEIKATYQYCF